MRSTATTTTIVAAVLLRACVSLHGYSGEGVPPMYGDFEAQRHWMEVTVNLPAERWYVHGPDNDLQYWGLDYPPLSAHFSWAVGRLAQAWHPQLVALHASRGHESAETRAFMRRSVLVADLLVFVPAALAFARLPAAAGGGGGAPTRTLALLLLSLVHSVCRLDRLVELLLQRCLDPGVLRLLDSLLQGDILAHLLHPVAFIGLRILFINSWLSFLHSDQLLHLP